MIKSWLSRYHPKYVRSLIYMLQASEYGIKGYLLWLNRVSDFRRVEQRKELIKTFKARLLIIMTWSFLVGYFILIFAALSIDSPWKILIILIGLILAPFLLVYLIIIPLLLIEVLQWPVEKIILSRMAKRLKQHQAVKIAIAGSFGKTTMREILKNVLSEGKKVAAPPYSYNTPLGISKFVRGLKGNEEILIFELGEYYRGDIQKLCQLIKPSLGIITGVNEAHLEKFKDLKTTAKTIFELAVYLEGKPVYVNGENKLARQHALSNYIIYSREGLGNWKVENAVSDLSGTSFTLIKEELKLDVKTKLLGLHQVGPLMVAADIALQLGLTPSQIKSGIEKTKPFDHRLELKMDKTQVAILDDTYNGNPDGAVAVIEFLASLKNHRRFYITPGLVEMGSQTAEVHQNIGRQLAKNNIEKVVLIRNSVTPYIAEGLKKAGFKGELVWFNDASEAFQALPYLTVAGDVVLQQNDWPDQYV